MFVVFCNGRFYGGGYQPCPQAKIDDGMIDVCLIKPVKKYQIVQLAKKYERGQHVQFSDLVSLHKVKVAHLDTDNQGILGNLDGEIRELKNPTIEIVEQAVHLVLPKKGE
jgi:diacylglycerol kinase family enzyme